MCTGMEALALASAAATAGGAYMDYQSAEAKAEAQRRAAAAEAMRQGEIDKEKFRNFDEGMKAFERDTQEGAINNALAERQALLDDATGLPGQSDSYQSPAANDAPSVVKSYADEQSAEADDFVSMLGNARARLGSWGEGMFDFNQALGDLAFDQDEQNRRALRSAQIGKREADLARAEAGNGMALAGGLLGAAGNAGMGYAGQQGAFSNMLGSGAGSASTGGAANAAATAGPGFKALSSPVYNMSSRTGKRYY